MKKIQQFALIATIFALTINASAAEENKTKSKGSGIAGWGFGAGVFDGDFGIQGRKDFNLSESGVPAISLQGSLHFQDKTTFRLDVDYHHVLTPNSPVHLYPLAGINFAIRSQTNRWGANLGGGMSISLTEHNDAFLELKYIFGDWSGVGFVVGIHF